MKAPRKKYVALATCLLTMAIGFCMADTLPAQPLPANLGVLTPGLTYGSVLEGLREGLAKFGYQTGKNLTLTIEDTKGEIANLDQRVKRLLETKPDVVFTVATAHSVAVKQASRTVPIVFTMVGDPLQAQLIGSYASSRNNVTGVSTSSMLLTAKRLELLKDIVPRATAILAIVSINETSAKGALPYLEQSAKQLGLRVVRRDVAIPEELEKIFAEKWLGAVDAIFPLPSVMVGQNIVVLAREANAERLPLIVNDESWVKAGALASYGTDFRSIGTQSAKLVAKVLKGIKPADIPVEPPDALVLTLNRGAAKAIGLKFPGKILERADYIFD